METFAQIVPLIILIPAVGAFINIFLGPRLSERAIAIIGTGASALAFGVALILYGGLMSTGYGSAVVNPPLLDGWIRIPAANIEIPWQLRVDTLSVLMMLIVSGVGTLIHIYAAGYMHGDERFHRFFAYLNMFLTFMLTLVAGNNFLVMFVGWEGVGLCSFLLIGFWFDRAKGVGWKNSNAARKAFIVNRIGDFGLLMGLFLTFYTFGTLDYYRPGEIANPEAGHHAEAGDHAGEGVAIEGEHEEVAGDETHVAGVAGEDAVEGDHGAADHGAVTTEGDHGDEHAATGPVYTNNDHIATGQLGVFGQAERRLQLPEGDPGRMVHIGPFDWDIHTVITLITLFFLLGATGKSAQIPLFVWLPDAMAGPTPVSALIHAATMVTAGVYLMVRSNVLYAAADLTSLIVTLIGVATALVAGFIAMGQWDIKKVLAYSTVSQLGFMVAAVGIGAYGAAMFHLMTHAFFKALLFLGSGSVIHGVEHGHHLAHGHGHGNDHGHDEHAEGMGHPDVHDAEAEASAHEVDEEHAISHDEEFDPQDMRNMGGLSKRMPVTYLTYLIGTLALAGIFPFAGFWSKDEILADSWIAGAFGNNVGGFIALGGLLVAAGFTAFYMWRQVEMVFHGRARTDAAAHAPESAPSMLIPLVILAFFSVFGGFLNTPDIVLFGPIFGAHRLTDFLSFSVVNAHAGAFQLGIAVIALALALGAIFLARSIYGNNRSVTADRRDPLAMNPSARPFWSLANARLYWDETYNRLFEQPFNRLAVFLSDRLDGDFWHDYVHDTILWKGFNAIGDILANPVDLGIIDWTVNGIGRLTTWLSGELRKVQTGYVRTYAVSLLLGVIIVLVILLLPWIQQTLAAGQ